MSLQQHAKSRENCEGLSEGLSEGINEGYVWVKRWGNTYKYPPAPASANPKKWTGWGSKSQFQNR